MRDTLKQQSVRGLPQYAINTALLQAVERIKQKTLCQLFEADDHRADHFSLDACGLHLDYSRNFVDTALLKQLLQLVDEASLQTAITGLFHGDKLNVTEGRAALHTALRDTQAKLAGADIAESVAQTLTQMYAFAEQLQHKRHVGYRNQPIRNIVILGIGGSYLGPKLVCEALKDYHHTDLTLDFVASLDGVELSDVLTRVNPATTMFIISSKSFTTLETLTNAKAAKKWLSDQGCPQQCLSQHFAAITANNNQALEFGVSDELIFPLWDWVGGRYSLWSAIGLPILLAVGKQHFAALLNGAYSMDYHFRTTSPEKNMPVILALLGIWQRNYLGIQTQAIMAYSFRLRHLAEHLQQLDMESNGKSVNIHGTAIPYDTAPIIWGGMGNNAQHACYQLLHQGSSNVAIDFILPCQSSKALLSHHQSLLAAQVFGQAQALMQGGPQSMDTTENGAPENFQKIPGNKSSNTILMASLTPESLGTLLALYEHKIFVQGICWQINSFDQWGVSLGKQLSQDVAQVIAGTSAETALDAAALKLMHQFKQTREKSRGRRTI